MDSSASPTRRARSQTARACRWVASSAAIDVPMAVVGGELERTTRTAWYFSCRPRRAAGISCGRPIRCGPVTMPGMLV